MSIRSALDRLKQIPAGTGRAIAESGDVVNVADASRAELATNSVVQASLGRVYQSNTKITVPSGGLAYFHQGIDAGIAIRSMTSRVVLTEGRVEARLLTGGVPGLVTSTLPAYNADRRLIDAVTPGANVGSNLDRVDGYTGGFILSQSTADATTSPVSASDVDSLTGAGVGGLFDSTVEPAFVIENTGTGPATMLITYVWAEVTDVESHINP